MSPSPSKRRRQDSPFAAANAAFGDLQDMQSVLVERFEKLETTLNSINEHLRTIDNRLESMDVRFNSLDARFSGLAQESTLNSLFEDIRG
ncbi:hypothetical protein KCU81_g1705, partial [Aureobasidium melanogenum]|uniref:Uncharacterized protein n=1 Tax=Aureobasidium melanogenum (strain CBS 110374) TaxID=1043003 RepID=A0A074VYA7_AURM1